MYLYIQPFISLDFSCYTLLPEFTRSYISLGENLWLPFTIIIPSLC